MLSRPPKWKRVAFGKHVIRACFAHFPKRGTHRHTKHRVGIDMHHAWTLSSECGATPVVLAQPLARQLGVYQPGGHHGRLRDGLEPVRHQPRSDPLALRGRLGSGFSRSLNATYCGPEIEPTLVSKNLRRSVLLGARSRR